MLYVRTKEMLSNLSSQARFTYLSDAHGTQYVQKYKRALRVIITRKISVRQALYPADRDERQSGDHSPIEYIVEHT